MNIAIRQYNTCNAKHRSRNCFGTKKYISVCECGCRKSKTYCSATPFKPYFSCGLTEFCTRSDHKIRHRTTAPPSVIDGPQPIDLLSFGKHEGRCYEHVYQKEPSYCAWFSNLGLFSVRRLSDFQYYIWYRDLYWSYYAQNRLKCETCHRPFGNHFGDEIPGHPHMYYQCIECGYQGRSFMIQ